MLSLFLLEIELPIFGSHPSMYDKYRSAIDQDKDTFRCFSDNLTIPLSKINDNFLDCSDGSDEPGTAIFLKGTFYCQNEGSTPKTIYSWSVNDGICDCCDGSDEMFNPHANCPNTCNPNSHRAPISNKNDKNATTQTFDLVTFKNSFKLPKSNLLREFFISIWKCAI